MVFFYICTRMFYQKRRSDLYAQFVSDSKLRLTGALDSIFSKRSWKIDEKTINLLCFRNFGYGNSNYIRQICNFKYIYIYIRKNLSILIYFYRDCMEFEVIFGVLIHDFRCTWTVFRKISKIAVNIFFFNL